MDKCYYEILETDITATQEEIQKAFRKLVKKWHPDVCKHPSAESKIKEINEAYEILKSYMEDFKFTFSGIYQKYLK